jgi:hypothetical protein
MVYTIIYDDSRRKLARLVLERMTKEPSELTIAMLAETIHSSFKRQRNPVVAYDRA